MTQIIEGSLAEILNKIDQRLGRMEESINDLKVSVVRLEEKVESKGKILNAKVDGLDKRIGSQEFINRSVLAALIVGIIGGFAKLFGFIDK
jgi:hypothetical protein